MNEHDDLFLSDILLSNMNMLVSNLGEKTKSIDRTVFLRSNAIENSALELDLKKHNLKNELEYLIGVYEKDFSMTNTKIYELHYDSNIEEVIFDKEKIIQAIDNLLSNATKFTNNGIILVEVTNDDDFIYISVKDSGIGIKQDDLKNICHLGFKGKDSHGNGVGLYYVNKVASSHGGDIKIRSKYGVGSEFKISIRLNQ